MLLEYIDEAMSRAKFEPLKDKPEYYGDIPECRGVWATGKTLAECKRNVREVLESWLFVHIKKGLPIPRLNGKSIQPLVRVRYDKAEAGQVA